MQRKRAAAGLWAIPGVGPRTFEDIDATFKVETIVDDPIGSWVELPNLKPHIRDLMPKELSLGEIGDRVLERAEQGGMKIAWPGEATYPERMEQIATPPPLLFYKGPGTAAPPRRRLAVVGMRYPHVSYLKSATQLLIDIARAGVGIVSGAAVGVDRHAHRCAAYHGGETWAFVGSALDELDDPQQRLWEELEPRGGTIWSELPPGVRADKRTFPRRNRLISGASDAVLVLFAAMGSGSKHTVKYALDQRRPVLARPGDVGNHFSELCNFLLAKGLASACIDLEDALAAVSYSGQSSHRPAPVTAKAVDVETLTADAQAAFKKVSREPKCFDELNTELAIGSGRLVAALFELTLNGLVFEHSGRRYERV